MTNFLYYGDNLQILRAHVEDESVDLVYLDPPFNSNANYNVLFRSPKGQQSHAQIEAFEDTWHWGEQAEMEFNELVHQPNTDVSEMMQSLRRFLGENDMMAYLTMMANRLLELYRVLTPTGSIYLHCDPTASHYLKVVMDGVFGKENFRNEIIWKRTTAHSGSKRWGDVHDVILFYSKSQNYCWNPTYQAYDESYLKGKYRYEDERGHYRLSDLTGDGLRRGDSGKPWRGFDPSAIGRHWAAPKYLIVELVGDEAAAQMSSQEKLDLLEAKGFIYMTPKAKSAAGAGFPQWKRYLGEGVPITSVISDIPPINSQADERLGYPTQKPVTLLERIIQASSNENDVVLDPFCGCGTAIHAAQKLKRRWIGIDITHLAISLVEKRLKDAFPGIAFEVHGTPKDYESARDLAHRDKYQFQWWVCSLIGAQPYQGKKKGADTGIDGIIYFQDDQSVIDRRKSLPKKIIVSVKGGEHVGVPMIRDLGHVVDREGAAIGLFITLAPPTRPMREEAVKAGYYSSPTGADFPKIQILTIEGLLNGAEQPRYPDLMRGGLMFKKSRKEVKEKQAALPHFPVYRGAASQPPLPGRDFSNSPLLDSIEDEPEE